MELLQNAPKVQPKVLGRIDLRAVESENPLREYLDPNGNPPDLSERPIPVRFRQAAARQVEVIGSVSESDLRSFRRLSLEQDALISYRLPQS